MDFGYSPKRKRSAPRCAPSSATTCRSARARTRWTSRSGMADLPALFKWNQDLYAKRWVGFNWPREVGGGGGSISEQMILKEEMARVKAPMLGLSYMGLAWVGPALIKYGTAGAEGAAHRSDPARRDPVVHRLLRARRRQRPGGAPVQGRPRRRRLRRQRPEDLDQPRDVGAVDDPARAHRSDGGEAPRHHLPARADEHARASP